MLLFHIQLLRPGYLTHHSSLLSRGYLAVDLFFVLSGFVMALTYRQSFLERPLGEAYRAFMVKRFARVIPLHAVLVTGIALVGCLSGSSTHILAIARQPLTLLRNVLLIQDWLPGEAIIPPAWSVSDEMGAYLVFPALLWLAWSRGWAATMAAAIAGVLALVWAGHGSLDVGRGWVVKPGRCFAEFFLGILVYRAYVEAGAKPRPWFTAATLITIIASLAWMPNDGLVVVLFPCLVYALAVDTSVVSRILGSDPWYYLGLISYAIYLTHWGVIWLLGAAITVTGPLWPAVLVCSLVISSACYFLIELPARKLIRKARWGHIELSRKPVLVPSATSAE